MFEIRNKILQIRKDRGISWEQWAIEAHKTPDTLKKQTGEAANPTLETLLEMLRPLGATVEILTNEEKELFSNLPASEQRRIDLEKQIEIFEDNRRSKETEIIKLSAIIEKQEKNIADLQKMLMDAAEAAKTKDAAIVRKDARIVELSKRLGIW